MSRFVAGFITILYVCAVSGQQQRGPPNDSSIRVGSVTGGSYPDGAFSINYGDGKGPLVPSSANVPQREEDLKRLKATNDSIAVGVVSGANFGDGAFSVNRDDNKPAPAGNTPYNGYDRPNNGYDRPNNGYDRPNNGYDRPNNGYDRPNNGYDSPNNGQGFAYDNNHIGDSQNPPYYGNKYDRRTTEAPASNSGTAKKGFFSTVRSYVSKWFFF